MRLKSTNYSFLVNGAASAVRRFWIRRLCIRGAFLASFGIRVLYSCVSILKDSQPLHLGTIAKQGIMYAQLKKKRWKHPHWYLRSSEPPHQHEVAPRSPSSHTQTLAIAPGHQISAPSYGRMHPHKQTPLIPPLTFTGTWSRRIPTSLLCLYLKPRCYIKSPTVWRSRQYSKHNGVGWGRFCSVSCLDWFVSHPYSYTHRILPPW